MKRLRIAVGITFGLIVSGCAVQPSQGPPGEGAVDAAMAPPDLKLHHDLAHDLTPPPSVAVKGTAVDEKGAPIPDVFMSVCNPMGCHSVNGGPGGEFLITGVQLIDFGVRSHDDDSVSPVRGTVVRLLHPTRGGEVFDVGTLYVPLMPAPAPFAGPETMRQTLSVGDGLMVTAVHKDLEFPVGVSTTTLAARAIPLERSPPFDLGTEQLVAVYAFMPYSVTSKSPVAITAPIALPAGTKVQFRSVYEFDGRLSTPVVGHAAGDGKSVSTDPGAGLDNLTWLLISR